MSMKKISLLLVSLIVGTHIQSANAVDMLRHIPVPVFGHYYPKGYHLMGGDSGVPKHCGISQDQAAHLTPRAVTAATGTPEFHLSIVGTRGRRVNDHAHANLDTVNQVAPPWNVLFHGWSGIANNTADNVNMGVFDAQGIQPQDLGNNRLVPLQVHPHGVFCSPNNAKFSAAPADAQFMSFGLVGSYQGRSIVVYQIVINNEAAQDMVDAMHHGFAGDIGTPAALLSLLNQPAFKRHFTKADDRARLEDTITKLRTITGGIAPVLVDLRSEPIENGREDPELAAILAESIQTNAQEMEQREHIRFAAEQLREQEELDAILAQIAAMPDDNLRAPAPTEFIGTNADQETLDQIAAMEAEQEQRELEIAIAQSLETARISEPPQASSKKKPPAVAPKPATRTSLPIAAPRPTTRTRRPAPTPPPRTQRSTNNNNGIVSELEKIFEAKRKK